MGIFNIFKKESKQIQGKIGYFGLSDWWLSNFSEAEHEKATPISDIVGKRVRRIKGYNISKPRELLFLGKRK